MDQDGEGGGGGADFGRREGGTEGGMEGGPREGEWPSDLGEPLVHAVAEGVFGRDVIVDV